MSDNYDFHDDSVEVEAEIKHETRKAYLVEQSGEEVWLPKTQVGNRMRRGGKLHITIPEWLAKKKGLDY